MKKYERYERYDDMDIGKDVFYCSWCHLPVCNKIKLKPSVEIVFFSHSQPNSCEDVLLWVVQLGNDFERLRVMGVRVCIATYYNREHSDFIWLLLNQTTLNKLKGILLYEKI